MRMNSAGVIPVTRRNAEVKVARDRNPVSEARASTVMLPYLSGSASILRSASLTLRLPSSVRKLTP